MFEEEFQAYLEADAGITALVDDHIYPIRRPEKSPMPAVSWHRASADRVYTYDPYLDAEPWVETRIQVDCWAYTALEMRDIGNAVLQALSGYDGSLSTTLMQSVTAVNELDTYDGPTQMFQRILDFRITYEDSVTAS